MMITGAHEQFVENTNYWLLVAGLQCQGCLKYILGIVYKLQGGALNYKEHYPLGKPDDEYPPRFPHP